MMGTVSPGEKRTTFPPVEQPRDVAISPVMFTVGAGDGVTVEVRVEVAVAV
jgi:hypothetical protein